MMEAPQSLDRPSQFDHQQHTFPSYQDIITARDTIYPYIKTIPMRLLHADISQDQKVYLKTENLQINNSYKIRGALNVISHLLNTDDKTLFRSGIVTASSGNFACQLAYSLNIRQVTTELTLVVPTFASQQKINKIREIYDHVRIVKLEPNDWIEIILKNKFDPHSLKIVEGSLNLDTLPFYISTATNFHVIAGSATVGLEIIDEIDDLNNTCVIIPYGGGGLTIGVATAMKHANPNIKFFACEVETGAPLKASLENSTPTYICFEPSFVDGIGSVTVIPHMFEKVKTIIEDSLVVSLDEVASSMKLLYDDYGMITEGAGACSVAAYLKYKNTSLKDFKKVVCLITGGSIEPGIFQSLINKPCLA